MNTGIYVFLALMIGVISAIYLPMNSSVSRYLGSPLTATITFSSVALVTTILIFLLIGDTATLKNIASVPTWLYLNGFISAFIVIAITFLIPRIGARQLVILSIAGQLLMAMIVSQLGVLESPKDPIKIKKVVSPTLLFSGAVVSVT